MKSRSVSRPPRRKAVHESVDPDTEAMSGQALRADLAARLERLAAEFPDRGLVVCEGFDPPEPGAVRIASSHPAPPLARQRRRT